MVYMQPTGGDLATQLAEAIEDYRATWEPVDTELYDLCRRRPSQREFLDVFTKVAIIGGVYNDGLARAWKGTGHPQTEMARCLIGQADLIGQALASLANSRLDHASLVEIVALHGTLTRILHSRAGGASLTVALSKYLHFHCPIVPICDSRAEETIKRFIDWTDGYSLQVSMDQPKDSDTRYFRYATKFLLLYKRAWAETRLRPTVKEVDHLLWNKLEG